MNHLIGMVGGGLGLLALLGSYSGETIRPLANKAINAYTGNVIYVNSSGNDDSNDGLSSDSPVKTMKKAFDLVDDYGTIVITDSIVSPYNTQEFYAAKNVKITSKINDEDYTSTGIWRRKCDTFFQGSVYLDDVKIEGAWDNCFVANGYDFHVGQNVTCSGGYTVGIVGGYAPLYGTVNENNPPVYQKGANVVVESGSNWDITGCGSNAFKAGTCGDQILQDADVNITVKGTASVQSIYGALTDRSCAPIDKTTYQVIGDSPISTIGNVNISVEGNSAVNQLIIGSDAQGNSKVKQLKDCAITVDIYEGATIKGLVGGSFYVYQAAGLTTIGPETYLESVVVNYHGGDVKGFTIGGVEYFYPTPPYTKDNTGCTEVIKDFRLNLYADLEIALNPGYAADLGYGDGYSELSSIDVQNATIAIYNGSTFEYDPLTSPSDASQGIHPFELKKRTVCYMDSGDRDTPMNIPEDFNPTNIEFGTDGDDKESVENNVFCATGDIEIGGIEADDSNFTIVLKGDEAPVVTVTDHISSDGGKFNLSFEKDDGTPYQPEEGTVVFKVPAVTTEEEKHAIEDMFILEGMGEEYYVEYIEGTDESGNPIGMLAIKLKPIPEVGYKVEHYQEQLDGSFVLVDTDDSLVGNSGDTVTGTVKSYDHYHLDESNENAVSSMTLDAESDPANNVLKLYYKLDTFKVVLNANVYGSFENGETKIVGEYRYGDSFPSVPSVLCNEGYVFDYWVDINGEKVSELPTTVTEDSMFTAVWKVLPQESEGEKAPAVASSTQKTGYIILHIIIGLILGAGATLAVVFTKKKLMKRR